MQVKREKRKTSERRGYAPPEPDHLHWSGCLDGLGVADPVLQKEGKNSAPNGTVTDLREGSSPQAANAISGAVSESD